MAGMKWIGGALMVSALTITACSSGPPPDFAPDPGLVARLRSIDLVPAEERACPGRRIGMAYFGVADDGHWIPFETDYDDDNPPALHVVMLRRSSRDASPQGDGNWRANPDPLVTAMSGFELTVSLIADPAVRGAITLLPEYSCGQSNFLFSGANGTQGRAGRDGPDVRVALDILRSPFVERLLVVSITVESAPAQYRLFDADQIPAADWIEIISRGGRGGRGVKGDDGVQGAAGTDGCPAGRGGPGGAGGVGGPGGPGGDGGRVTVVVPDDEPFLAGLVKVESPGGQAGRGGVGGAGGPGGAGGSGTGGQRRCAPGESGPEGPGGVEGRAGRDGRRGPSMEIVEVPGRDVFGPRVDPALNALLEYSRGG